MFVDSMHSNHYDFSIFTFTLIISLALPAVDFTSSHEVTDRQIFFTQDNGLFGLAL